MSTNNEAGRLKKLGLYALLLGILLEVIYLALYSSFILGLAGPILFIYGLVQLIRGLIKKPKTSD